MAVLCTERNSVDIKDGTLCRAESPKPGLLGWLWSRAESTVESAYDDMTSAVSSAVKSSLNAVNAAYHLAQHELNCTACLAEAYVRAQLLAPRAILEETGHELGQILKGLLPSIGLMLLVLGTTTALGATIGGVISGIFSAGALAVPGAIAGGEVGFDLGMAALSWLGVAFLIVSMAEGLKEVFALLKQGILDGWGAGSLAGAEQKREVEKSARELARMQGIFFRVLLQGIIAYLLKEAGIKSTRSAMQTAAVIRGAGVEAAAAGTALRMTSAVNALVMRLQANRWLGGAFADWVARDWGKMMENPKLEVKTSPAAAEEAAGESRVGHSSNGAGGQPKPSGVGRNGGPPPDEPTSPLPVKRAVKLKYKDDWTPEQIIEADRKVGYLNEMAKHGQAVVSGVKRSGTSARNLFEENIPEGKDIDHKLDIQLGGSETDPENLWPLDSSVNRSLGPQISNKIKDLPAGTKIDEFTIDH